ncbi:alpha/beta fold hydrolase [Actinoplanes derwentensis]|uniref:Serine aminopeptidase, S33 n=1 Tax=Actinoplanes derwentensis TaxID=113562 RepID=A0A1H1R848_9ACTN|nr:alpha/beta hydrolase [Actinoplanes derwentensis]GID88041.1 alpha/beta hydrolase [Actinoplanes derwentensis]SDS31964.1 Serine aminopeptidase, S33 [Actinoplanes derwentensis]
MTGRTGTAERMRTDDGAHLATSVTEGAGRTVVLVHGWGGARSVWDRVASRLTGLGYRVVSYDQRGHGGSTTGRDGIGIDRLRADLAQVLDRFDADGAILAGHSGGGYTALAYAGADPVVAGQRLRGLVLAGTAAYGQDTPAGELRMMGNPVFSWALRRPGLGRRMLGGMLAPGSDRALAEQNRELFAAVQPAVRRDFFRVSCGMDLRAGLESVTVPAVVLAGEHDKIVAPAYGEQLSRTLPTARFEQIPGAGHMLPLERPEHIVRAVTGLG